MVCACCWRSVETRAYTATRTGIIVLLRWLRRLPPAQEELIRPVPPPLPVRVLDRLPAEAPPTPHRCPPCCRSRSPGVPLERATAATGRGATRSSATVPSGSSRICHLRVDHRGDLLRLQAIAGLRGPAEPSPPGRAAHRALRRAGLRPGRAVGRAADRGGRGAHDAPAPLVPPEGSGGPVVRRSPRHAPPGRAGSGGRQVMATYCARVSGTVRPKTPLTSPRPPAHHRAHWRNSSLEDPRRTRLAVWGGRATDCRRSC